MPLSSPPRTTADLAPVSASASSVQLFAENEAAVGRAILNDSTATLYLKFGETASTIDYTVKMGAGDYFEFPTPLYGGVTEGIWSSATGSARVTEW